MDMCDIIRMPLREIKPTTVGWMYPKNSLLQHMFDKFMIELYQNGIIDRLLNSLKSQKVCDEDDSYQQVSKNGHLTGINEHPEIRQDFLFEHRNEQVPTARLRTADTCSLLCTNTKSRRISQCAAH